MLWWFSPNHGTLRLPNDDDDDDDNDDDDDVDDIKRIYKHSQDY